MHQRGSRMRAKTLAGGRHNAKKTHLTDKQNDNKTRKRGAITMALLACIMTSKEKEKEKERRDMPCSLTYLLTCLLTHLLPDLPAYSPNGPVT